MDQNDIVHDDQKEKYDEDIITQRKSILERTLVGHFEDNTPSQKLKRFKLDYNELENRQNFDFSDPYDMQIINTILKKQVTARSKPDIEILYKAFREIKFIQDMEKDVNQMLIRKMLKNIQIAQYNKKDRVFNQGEIGSNFYIIVSGSVWVLVPNKFDYNVTDEQQRISKDILANPQLFTKMNDEQFISKAFPSFNQIATLKSGYSFGEIALRQQTVRTATVVAAEDTVCAVVSRDIFHSCISEFYKIQRDKEINFLHQFHLFADLYKQDVEMILMSCVKHNFTKNHVIYSEKQPSDTIYFLQEGEVEISKQADIFTENPNDLYLNRTKELHMNQLPYRNFGNSLSYKKTIKRVPVVKVCPDTMFGEEEAFNDKNRETQATIVSNQAAYYILKIKDFNQIMQKKYNPEFIEQLKKDILIQKIKHRQEKLCKNIIINQMYNSFELKLRQENFYSSNKILNTTDIIRTKKKSSSKDLFQSINNTAHISCSNSPTSNNKNSNKSINQNKYNSINQSDSKNQKESTTVNQTENNFLNKKDNKIDYNQMKSHYYSMINQEYSFVKNISNNNSKQREFNSVNQNKKSSSFITDPKVSPERLKINNQEVSPLQKNKSNQYHHLSASQINQNNEELDEQQQQTSKHFKASIERLKGLSEFRNSGNISQKEIEVSAFNLQEEPKSQGFKMENNTNLFQQGADSARKQSKIESQTTKQQKSLEKIFNQIIETNYKEKNQQAIIETAYVSRPLSGRKLSSGQSNRVKKPQRAVTQLNKDSSQKKVLNSQLLNRPISEQRSQEFNFEEKIKQSSSLGKQQKKLILLSMHKQRKLNKPEKNFYSFLENHSSLLKQNDQNDQLSSQRASPRRTVLTPDLNTQRKYVSLNSTIQQDNQDNDINKSIRFKKPQSIQGSQMQYQINIKEASTNRTFSQNNDRDTEFYSHQGNQKQLNKSQVLNSILSQNLSEKLSSKIPQNQSAQSKSATKDNMQMNQEENKQIIQSLNLGRRRSCCAKSALDTHQSYSKEKEPKDNLFNKNVLIMQPNKTDFMQRISINDEQNDIKLKQMESDILNDNYICDQVEANLLITQAVQEIIQKDMKIVPIDPKNPLIDMDYIRKCDRENKLYSRKSMMQTRSAQKSNYQSPQNKNTQKQKEQSQMQEKIQKFPQNYMHLIVDQQREKYLSALSSGQSTPQKNDLQSNPLRVSLARSRRISVNPGRFFLKGNKQQQFYDDFKEDYQVRDLNQDFHNIKSQDISLNDEILGQNTKQTNSKLKFNLSIINNKYKIEEFKRLVKFQLSKK